jgi:glucose-6-phosphate isomerase
VPGRPYTFGQLQRAQAAGDARVLLATRQPVVRLHLTERQAGLSQLLAAATRADS